MKRVQGQLLAGVDYVPVVDLYFRPVTIGCTLRASVATYKGHLAFQTVEVTVRGDYLPYCVIRGDGWCIPFYYDSVRRVMVGTNVSSTFPVWCEVL